MTKTILANSREQSTSSKAKRNLSTAALAAKAIRIELKKAFPGTKFSVRSEIYSGGDSVNVFWKNGPTTSVINAIIKKYQYGHFDGMTDCYEFSNRRNNIPQVKFVFANRSVDHSLLDQTTDCEGDVE